MVQGAGKGPNRSNNAREATDVAAAATKARTTPSRDRHQPLGREVLEPVFRLLSKYGTPAIAAQAAGMAVRGKLMVMRSLANHQLPATKAGSRAYRATVAAAATPMNKRARSVARGGACFRSVVAATVIHTAATQAPAARMDSTRSTASSCDMFTAAAGQAVLGDAGASEDAALGGSGWGFRATARARLKSQ